MRLYIFFLLIILSEVALFDESRNVNARRIIAIGDLHGDYNQSRAVLQVTGLLDSKDRWIGKDAILVQLGDILDVGPDDIAIEQLFMRLQKEARAKGGDVVQLLGNHELRNFQGDFTAVEKNVLRANGGKKGRSLLLSNQTELGRYLRTRKAIYQHGPFLFMHGGLSTRTATILTSLSKVNKFNTELHEANLNGSISSLAKKGLSLNEDNAADVVNPILVRSILNVKCKELKKVLDKNFPSIRSVIVGHVPHNPQNFHDWRLCDGRLIDIDFGLSRWKKGDPGHVAALEIDEPSWHVQLIEATMMMETERASSLNSVHFFWHQYRSSFLFIVLLIIVVGSIIYLLNLWRRKKTRALSEQAEVTDYGAL